MRVASSKEMMLHNELMNLPVSPGTPLANYVADNA
jgi:hypothetical protein